MTFPADTMSSLGVGEGPRARINGFCSVPGSAVGRGVCVGAGVSVGGRELEKGIIEAKDACMKVFASFEEK